jgi:hypothetical protein
LLQLLAPSTQQALGKARSGDSEIPEIQFLRRVIESVEPGSYVQLRIAAILVALRDEKRSSVLSGSLAIAIAECANVLAGIPESEQARRAELDEFRRLATIDSAKFDLQSMPATSLPDSAAPAIEFAGITKRLARQQPGDDDAQSRNDEIAWRILAQNEVVAGDLPGLPASDAGMVLLHPFLSRFLETTGIVANPDRELPFHLLPRAAALLHWLATGRDEVFEYELSLIKLLLGLAPAGPLLVAQGLLNDDDRAEGEALLSAVIGHWSALGRTSIAGLRQSFLQRRGLIREGQHGWHLQVESASFDVLLGRLPWGIDIVKLPWMTRPIITDWPTR